jgi:hypothetical protein
MKTKTMLLTLAAVAGGITCIALAQDAGGPPAGGNQAGPGMGRHRQPPIPLIVKALDANGDGVIDADEIANAVAALKTLDKNGDGKLTRDEYLGKPPGPPQGGNGAGGPPPDGGMPPQDGPGGPPPADN